jgi:hypothetical protein
VPNKNFAWAYEEHIRCLRITCARGDPETAVWLFLAHTNRMALPGFEPRAPITQGPVPWAISIKKSGRLLVIGRHRQQ